MENYTLYDIHEIIALVTATLIGTGAYVGFLIVKKRQKIGVSFMFWTYLINLFLAYLGSQLLTILNWGGYRALVLPLIAYLGQYLMDWVDTRYLKVFDAGLKKVGLDVNTDNNYEETEDNDFGDMVEDSSDD